MSKVFPGDERQFNGDRGQTAWYDDDVPRSRLQITAAELKFCRSASESSYLPTISSCLICELWWWKRGRIEQLRLGSQTDCQNAFITKPDHSFQLAQIEMLHSVTRRWRGWLELIPVLTAEVTWISCWFSVPKHPTLSELSSAGAYQSNSTPANHWAAGRSWSQVQHILYEEIDRRSRTEIK